MGLVLLVLVFVLVISRRGGSRIIIGGGSTQWLLRVFSLDLDAIDKERR